MGFLRNVPQHHGFWTFFPQCPFHSILEISSMFSDFSVSNLTATGSAVPAPSPTEMVGAGCESQLAVAK